MQIDKMKINLNNLELIVTIRVKTQPKELR